MKYQPALALALLLEPLWSGSATCKDVPPDAPLFILIAHL
jgi:hypothetical protein